MEICDRIPKLQEAIGLALKGLKCKEGITYPATLDGLSAVLECIPDNFYDRVIHLVNESCQDANKTHEQTAGDNSDDNGEVQLSQSPSNLRRYNATCLLRCFNNAGFRSSEKEAKK